MKHFTDEFASQLTANHSTSKEVCCERKSHDATRSLLAQHHSEGQPEKSVKRLISDEMSPRFVTTYAEKSQLPKLHENRVVKCNINVHYN